MRDPPSCPLLPQGRKRELATPQSLTAPYNRRCRGPRLFWNFLAASDAFSASCKDRERTCGKPCQNHQPAEIDLALFACLPGQNYRNGAIASLRSRKSAFELPFANKVAGNTADCRRDSVRAANMEQCFTKKADLETPGPPCLPTGFGEKTGSEDNPSDNFSERRSFC